MVRGLPRAGASVSGCRPVKFKTHWALTLLLATLGVLFFQLGRWQSERAVGKEVAQAAFDDAATLPSLDAPAPDWSHITLSGTLDSQRHLLLDNKLFRGRPGVHVLTPLALADREELVLVNRGWLPLPVDRSSLPTISTPAGRVTVSGRLAQLSQPGVRLGEPETLQLGQWPQLLVYPEWATLEAALDAQLLRQVLYLDASDAAGFEDRQWAPFTMGPDRHRAYAVQWYGLCLTAFVIWLVLGFNAGRRSAA